MDETPHGATPDHAGIARQLAAREPIFHRPEWGIRRADFDRMISADYWEVGASGRVYTRDFVLDVLEERHRAGPVSEHLVVTDFACRRVGGDTWLATYRLEQAGGRLSRRATLWQRAGSDWIALYHQGTLIGG